MFGKPPQFLLDRAQWYLTWAPEAQQLLRVQSTCLRLICSPLITRHLGLKPLPRVFTNTVEVLNKAIEAGWWVPFCHQSQLGWLGRHLNPTSPPINPPTLHLPELHPALQQRWPSSCKLTACLGQQKRKVAGWTQMCPTLTTCPSNEIKANDDPMPCSLESKGLHRLVEQAGRQRLQGWEGSRRPRETVLLACSALSGSASQRYHRGL